MDNGLIQVFFGSGKGKTSAAVGSVVRACGQDQKCLFYQFLKDSSSGEVSILKSLQNCEYLENTVKTPFLFNAGKQQLTYYNNLYKPDINRIKEKIFSGDYDLVVLDEAIDAFNLNILAKSDLLEIMDNKPKSTELIITGHEYKEISIEDIKKRADYITEFKKEKHPFDKGQPARKGIEF